MNVQMIMGNVFLAALWLSPSGSMAGDIHSGEKVMPTVVRYEDYGAKGDGKTDDSEAIAKAHEFANQHRLPVCANDQASYYIGGQDRTAVIETDTDFGSATFLIDDTAVENVRAPVFHVRSTLASVKPKGISTLKENQSRIDAMFLGACVVQAKNDKVKHFIRKGGNQNSGSVQTDVFLVDADGKVADETPIQWDFAVISEIIAYPVDEKTLTIKGGRFTTIANAGHPGNTYYARGITITRSNVVVEDLEHRITGEGEKGAPYGGIIVINDCANVTVRNTLVTGHKTYWKPGKLGEPVPMGSYGISINRSLNITLQNVKQTNDIHDKRYWGIMCSNFCKNLVLDGCSLSRFDAHQGVYNATIRNSEIGHMGILAIGKGTLLVENTTIKTRHFMGFRSDYGSTWRGDVIIRNSVFAPPNPKDAVIFSGNNTGDHDFGYACTMPERITLDGFRVDDGKAPAGYQGLAIFGNFNPKFKANEKPQPYPYTPTKEIILKHVTTASGKPLRVSDNAPMLKDVVVMSSTM